MHRRHLCGALPHLRPHGHPMASALRSPRRWSAGRKQHLQGPRCGVSLRRQLRYSRSRPSRSHRRTLRLSRSLRQSTASGHHHQPRPASGLPLLLSPASGRHLRPRLVSELHLRNSARDLPRPASQASHLRLPRNPTSVTLLPPSRIHERRPLRSHSSTSARHRRRSTTRQPSHPPNALSHRLGYRRSHSPQTRMVIAMRTMRTTGLSSTSLVQEILGAEGLPVFPVYPSATMTTTMASLVSISVAWMMALPFLKSRSRASHRPRAGIDGTGRRRGRCRRLFQTRAWRLQSAMGLFVADVAGRS